VGIALPYHPRLRRVGEA